VPSPAERAAKSARLERERTRQEREVFQQAIAIISQAPRGGAA
jgi:hypothetical protein